MKKTSKRFLSITFIVDAVIAISFGLYSWFFPRETFGTILIIPETHSSAFLAILSSLSLFYVLTGLTCMIGLKSTPPISRWIGLLMVVRHLFEGILKMGDLGKDWLIGNPYPDLVIHSVFVIIYGVSIFYNYRLSGTRD